MKLLESFTLGQFNLKNRMVMAPLTRMRANEDLAPGELHVLYYRQRAGAGLIISEASQISPMGYGYPYTPGIYSQKQIASWKMVTEAVHQAGGLIFMQLWHVGRHSHPELLGGALPVAPSAINENGHVTTLSGKHPSVTPRAMSLKDIRTTIEDYSQAAENAIMAGFDGVEIHAANGYLIEQFLNDSSNIREDAYGGSIENKCRFALEVMDEIIRSVGHERTGIRLSPSGMRMGVYNYHPKETYQYLLEEISKRNLAYVHLSEPDQEEVKDHVQYPEDVAAYFKPFVKAPIINSVGFHPQTAELRLQSGVADLIAFGKYFIANPDFPARVRNGGPYNSWDPDTFYGGDEKGYTDYPFLKEQNNN